MPDQAGGSPYLKTESRFFRERNNRAKVHDGKSLEFARNKLDDRAASLIDLDFTHRDSFIAPPAAGRDDVAGYGRHAPNNVVKNPVGGLPQKGMD